MEQNAHDFLTVPADIGDGVELHSFFHLFPSVILSQKYEVSEYFSEILNLLELKKEGVFTLSMIEEKFTSFINSIQAVAKINQNSKMNFIHLRPFSEKNIFAKVEKQNTINLNFVIQMPTGAKFSVDTNSDGSPNIYSRFSDLKNGDVFLLNTGANVKWENPTEKDLIIFSLNAYPQITKEEILMMAKTQNKVSSHRELMNMLSAKKSFFGMKTDAIHVLYQDLTNWGISPRIIPSFISLGVFTETLDEPLLQEEALQITKASIGVLEPETFPISLIDSWMLKKKREGKKFVILFAAGTYIENLELFMLEAIRLIGEMQIEKTPLMAHLMDKKEKLPFLHEQFLILNLDLIDENNFKFGMPYEKYELYFPAYLASPEHIHDDYTPLWMMAAASNGGNIYGQGTFGTEFLAKLFLENKKVKNIPISLRKLKKYIYPKEGRGEEYRKVRSLIKCNWLDVKDKIFIFNTEQLKLREYKIEPEIFIFPCAGFKPLVLYSQFRGSDRSAKCIFVEKNKESILFYRELLTCESRESVENLLLTYLIRQNALPDSGKSYVKNMMSNIINEAFMGDNEFFIQNLNAISQRAQFIELDYFLDQEKLLSFFSVDKQALFWHSNAWESQQAYFRMTAAELRKNYFKFIDLLTKKVNTKSWVHKNAYEAVIGNDFYSPKIILSAGGSPQKPPKESAFDSFISPLSCF